VAEVDAEAIVRTERGSQALAEILLTWTQNLLTFPQNLARSSSNNQLLDLPSKPNQSRSQSALHVILSRSDLHPLAKLKVNDKEN
jgi:hypothetical protein